jgi:hypothetical protein
VNCLCCLLCILPRAHARGWAVFWELRIESSYKSTKVSARSSGIAAVHRGRTARRSNRSDRSLDLAVQDVVEQHRGIGADKLLLLIRSGFLALAAESSSAFLLFAYSGNNVSVHLVNLLLDEDCVGTRAIWLIESISLHGLRFVGIACEVEVLT